MENRVRDLDQIEERDSDERSRRLGTILLATTSIVGLTFAMGVVVGRAAEPEAAVDDPLAKLAAPVATQAAKAPEGATALPKVDVADLSFPSTLSEAEDRPEVLAALQAAAAEEAALAEPNAAPEPTAALAAVAAVAADAEPVDVQPAEVEPEELVASIPAAVAAGPGARSLPKSAKHDKLVAASVQTSDDVVEAPHGHDGEYTLQVISYDRPEPSRAFAEGLRKKGHTAFVASAEVAERGRYYRVRIGPFETRELAEAYRTKFEEDEHMNTYVVRQKPE